MDTYSGDISYFDGRDKELDASYLKKKLCKKKYLLEFEKGELIITQGEEVDACYYLDKGYVIAYETVKGRRRIFDAFNSNNPVSYTHLAERSCRSALPLLKTLETPSQPPEIGVLWKFSFSHCRCFTFSCTLRHSSLQVSALWSSL